MLLFVLFPQRNVGEDAKTSEARATLGALKDRARVVYHQTKIAPQSLDELGVSDNELTGNYFTRTNYTVGGNAKKWWAKCTGVFSAEPTYLYLESDLETGASSFNR